MDIKMAKLYSGYHSLAYLPARRQLELDRRLGSDINVLWQKYPVYRDLLSRSGSPPVPT